MSAIAAATLLLAVGSIHVATTGFDTLLENMSAPREGSLVTALFFGFSIGEISCPTRYFAEASSIDFASA